MSIHKKMTFDSFKSGQKGHPLGSDKVNNLFILILAENFHSKMLCMCFLKIQIAFDSSQCDFGEKFFQISRFLKS